MKKINKAQSILESTVVFLAGSMIIGAAIGFFAWGVAHLPARQLSYERTRVFAGTSSRTVSARGASDGRAHRVWPTYRASPALE